MRACCDDVSKEVQNRDVKWREWQRGSYSRCSTYLRRPEDNELDYHPTPDAVKYDSITSLSLCFGENSQFPNFTIRHMKHRENETHIKVV